MQDTKFYFIDEDKPAEEIQLNRDNWFFVQMYWSIRYAFLDYGAPLPKYAYIDKSYEKTKHMDILLIMDDIGSFNKNKMRQLCIQEELDRQANANSDEGYMTYKFEIC